MNNEELYSLTVLCIDMDKSSLTLKNMIVEKETKPSIVFNYFNTY